MELVSIIMPAFNCENFIKISIESALNQSYENLELLICDDGSTDRTLDIIKQFSLTDNRLKVVKNIFEKGAAGARNSCLKSSKGRYIAFLDSDDLWHPDKLKLQIRFMQDEEVPFSYSYYQNIDENGKKGSIVISPSRLNFKLMSYSNFIGCLTVILDSNVIKNICQPNIKKRNDYALWLKILLDNPSIRIKCLKEPLGFYRVNAYGLSSNILDSIFYFYKCLRDYAKLGIFVSFIKTIIYLFLTFFKKRTPDLYNKCIKNLV